MFLRIPYRTWNKVNFFLKKFPSTEWSGPAWYKPTYEEDEKYPVGFELIHFHPVDLGHGTRTVVDAGDTAKILQKTWKNYPETEQCMMGIIHSHHTMGAFFSSTDTTCLKDNAPIENFYCSTVVASKTDKFAFAVSYADQYDNVHVEEIDKDEIALIMPADTEESKWKYIAKGLEKKKENESKGKISYGYYGGNGRYNGHVNQGALWGATDTVQDAIDDVNGYGYPYGHQLESPSNSKDEKVIDALKLRANSMADPESGYITLLAESYKDNRIFYETFKDELDELGIDILSFITAWNDPSNTNTKEVLDVLALPEASEESRLNTTVKA